MFPPRAICKDTKAAPDASLQTTPVPHVSVCVGGFVCHVFGTVNFEYIWETDKLFTRELREDYCCHFAVSDCFSRTMRN